MDTSVYDDNTLAVYDDDAALAAPHDSSVFADLYRRHRDRVYHYLLARCGDTQLAQDLTSQTFLAALEGIRCYRGNGRFSTWLLAIASHKLADPSRRALFEALTRGEAAVKDLTARFDISQPAISQHLAILKDAGLVNSRREGRCVYYRVEPHGMKPLIDWIAHYRAFWTEHIDRLEQLLENIDE